MRLLERLLLWRQRLFILPVRVHFPEGFAGHFVVDAVIVPR